jgi:hypothetical protein
MALALVVLLVAATVVTRPGTRTALLPMVVTVVGMPLAMVRALLVQVGLVVLLEPLFEMVAVVHNLPTPLASRLTTGEGAPVPVVVVAAVLVAIQRLVQMLPAVPTAAVVLTSSSMQKSMVAQAVRVVPVVLQMAGRQVARH